METIYYTVQEGEVLVWQFGGAPSLYNSPARGSDYGAEWLRDLFSNRQMTFVPWEVVELLTNG